MVGVCLLLKNWMHREKEGKCEKKKWFIKWPILLIVKKIKTNPLHTFPPSHSHCIQWILLQIRIKLMPVIRGIIRSMNNFRVFFLLLFWCLHSTTMLNWCFKVYHQRQTITLILYVVYSWLISIYIHTYLIRDSCFFFHLLLLLRMKQYESKICIYSKKHQFISNWNTFVIWQLSSSIVYYSLYSMIHMIEIRGEKMSLSMERV